MRPALAALSVPDTLLPTQMDREMPRDAYGRLAVGIMEDAISIYFGKIGNVSGEERIEARRWIEDPDYERRAFFSFPNCCEALEIDETTFRNRLMLVRSEKQSLRVKHRLVFGGVKGGVFPIAVNE